MTQARTDRRQLGWAVNLFAVAAAMWVCAAAGAQGTSEVGWSDRVPRIEGRHEHFVSPEGKAENAGTKEQPWDLASALAGKQPIRPGDIVWVRGGVYKGQFQAKLAGKADAPIIVRGYGGERVTILDSGIDVVTPADYLWLWDLEIAGSVPVGQRRTQQTGSHPSGLPGRDGLIVHAGRGCRFIDLIIHDNAGSGMSWWVGSTDSEVHGCIFYNNGWKAPDRGHGHCIYTQNRNGTKTVSGCIFTVPNRGSYTLHAYGSSQAYVDNYLVEDNIAFAEGPFLVGGGRPSHNIHVLRNYLYGVSMQIGYGAQNEDCEVRGNIVANGSLTISKYKKVAEQDSLRQMPDAKAILIPNRYDPNRAHVAVYNGRKAAEVALDASAFLKPGEKYRLLSPMDFFGKSVREGRCDGGEIRVPGEAPFAAWVLVKQP